MSEGSVFQRADGKWCAKWKDAAGKWRYLYRKTKAEAKKALRQALKDRDDGIIPADKVTVGDALDAWLEEIKETTAPRTYVNRESVARCQVKTHRIAKVKLTALKPDDLRAFYRDKRRSGLVPESVARLHNILNKICETAVRNRSIRFNPAADVKPPKKGQRREVEVLTPEQVKRLLDTVRGHRWEGITILGALCAFRIGEALALRYEDLDLEAGTVSIRRTLWRNEVHPPKTPQSRSTLKMPAIALDAMRRLSESNGTPAEGWCFPTRSGNPCAASNFWRCGWKPALRRAGLRETLRYHELRHTAGSLLLNSGLPVPVVSKYLRHVNPNITMSVYAHVLKGTSGLASEAMDDLLEDDAV